MANVSFLKGTQQGFDDLSAYKAGAFYLTTDTHRLYFADTTSKANYLNKYVHTVANADALKTAIANGTVVNGDFAYVSGANALVAIQNGTYVQINTYSNDDTKTTALTFTKNTVNADDTEIVFNYTLNQQTKALDGTTVSLTPITGSFSLTAADIKSVIDIAVGVGATISSGTATVKTSGTGSAGNGFTIKGSGSVQVGGSNNAITITGTDTQYTLTSPAGDNNIILTASDNTVNKVAIVEGNQIAVDSSVDKQIKIDHGTITTTPTTSQKQAIDNGTFDVISGVTVDNGHITGYNTQTVTLPKAPEYVITDITGSNDGKVSITLKDNTSSTTKTVSSDADFYVYVGKGENKEKKFIQDDLEVYTIDEIDAKLKGVNSMVYKGTVGSSQATVTVLPDSSTADRKVSIGDTYKVDLKGTYGGYQCEPGDLLIAIITDPDVTEDANGYIPQGSVKWTHVPSGNDYDATFSLSPDTTNNKFTLIEDLDSTAKGSVTLQSTNDAIAISSTKSGKDMTLKLTHKEYAAPTKDTASKAPASSTIFTAITGLETDKGHITKFTETTYTLPVEKDSQYDLTAAGSGTTNKAKISLTGVAGSDAEGDVDNIYLVAGTDLTNTTSSNTITFNHKTYNAPSTATVAGALGTNTSKQSTITAVTSIEASNGHVTKVNSSTFALPKDSKYELSDITLGAITIGNDKGYKFTNTLAGLKDSGAEGDSDTAVFSLVSSSLTLASTTDSAGKAAMSINLEWGSF